MRLKLLRSAQHTDAPNLTGRIDYDCPRPRVSGQRSDQRRLAVVPKERLGPGGARVAGGTHHLSSVIDVKSNAVDEVTDSAGLPENGTPIRAPDRLSRVVNRIYITLT